jgi:hypothetical protein
VKSKFRVVEGDKKPSIFQDLEALRIPPDADCAGEGDGTRQPIAKRRQFRRFDETWVEKLLPLLNPIGRLALVLLAEADFHRHIKVTSEVAKEARLTLKQQRGLLLQMEQLGLISIERRGRGRAQIATPLRLGGRPGRR